MIIEFDVVEQASMDSFPASDPPGWIRSPAAPSPSTVAPRPEDRSPWRRWRKVAAIAGAVSAAAGIALVIVRARRGALSR